MERNGKTYDQFHAETVVHKDVVYPVLGLGGETGEVLEVIKKAWRKYGDKWTESEETRFKVLDELGDVVWYATRLAHLLGSTLDQVLLMNMEKLEDRKKNGK